MSVTAELHTVTEESFGRDVLHASRPVLVDFYATWCPPCRQIEPVLTELAAEEADRLAVLRVDVDEQPELARRHGVLGMPSLLLFVGGVERLRLVGTRPKRRLVAELADVLGER
jgi:thioredoxin 1